LPKEANWVHDVLEHVRKDYDPVTIFLLTEVDKLLPLGTPDVKAALLRSLADDGVQGNPGYSVRKVAQYRLELPTARTDDEHRRFVIGEGVPAELDELSARSLVVGLGKLDEGDRLLGLNEGTVSLRAGIDAVSFEQMPDLRLE
jgi:hypothetical protein